MAYLGKSPVVGNFQKCDAITVVNGQAGYTLQVGGSNVSPESANHMLVSLNGILQAPTSSFTVSGATLTFVSNLATGDVIDFVMLLGNVLDIGTPSDGTVTNAKLGTDVISGETDIGGAIADADLFLVDDGAGGTLRKSAMSRVKTYVGGGITEADQWRLTANITSDVNPIASNLERVDDASFEKIGTGMSESSGTWTFPTTGLYMVKTNVVVIADGNDNIQINVYATLNDSAYDQIAYSVGGGDSSGDEEQGTGTTNFVNVTDVSNVKVRFGAGSIGTSSYMYGSSNMNASAFSFIRLGDSQ